jgi:hypothetical protein
MGSEFQNWNWVLLFKIQNWNQILWFYFLRTGTEIEFSSFIFQEPNPGLNSGVLFFEN